MSKSSLLALVAKSAMGLLLLVPAGAATITVSNTPFQGNGSFDSGTLPTGWTASGSYADVRTGSIFNVQLAPTGDSTAYAYVGNNSAITADFSSAPIVGFTLYWGSVDDYNEISFTDVNGGVTNYFGSSIPGLTPNGALSSYVTFADTGAAWKTVTFTSQGVAFEFDDFSSVAATVATPEPISIALCTSGLLLLAGSGALRKRKNR